MPPIMDEETLDKARTAWYTQTEVSEVPEDLREKYFEKSGGRYYFNKDMRRMVIFGRHNLIQDAPISRIDLLLCRNVLIYFNVETQARVLSRLHYALRPEGYLFLGKAEMLLSHTNLFTAVNLKHRVFSRVSLGNQRGHYLPSALPRNERDTDSFIYSLPKIREAASDSNPIAQIATDAEGTLVLANAEARALFNLSSSDIGRPIQDLKLSYQPVDLRTLIDQAKDLPEPKELREVSWGESESNERYFDISVATLKTEENKLIGVSLSFMDVTGSKQLQKQLEHTNQDLETAMEELESTNEELETTNEELQSTIEELETTNEELQATNEELETLNSEMGLRTAELNEVIASLNSILASFKDSVILIKDYLVEVWNPTAEELWGVRKEEVLGQSFFGLDIGLPVEKLKHSIRTVLKGENGQESIEITATNRRGQTIQLQGSTTPFYNRDKKIAGVILRLEPEPSNPT